MSSKTLLISDLHIGDRKGRDLLRSEHVQAALFSRLDDCDRLVLLGDVLELRHGSFETIFQLASPFLQQIGSIMRGREIVLIPGNHDHRVLAEWFKQQGDRCSLSLDTEVSIDAVDRLQAVVQTLGKGVDVAVHYPGYWVRDDVYAMHGHYIDRHMTVPTVERLAAGLVGRFVGAVPPGAATPDDYESALGPLYSLLELVIDNGGARSSARNSNLSARLWRQLSGDSDSAPAHLRFFAANLLPSVIKLLNVTGLGPLNADLSVKELYEAGLRACSAVAQHLDIEAKYLISGHTHRPGPLRQDDPELWQTEGGVNLVNTGSWIYDPMFLGPSSKDSAYWPGTVIEVADSGPPVVSNLLTNWQHDDFLRLKPAA